jgi:opine dehydrogenase
MKVGIVGCGGIGLASAAWMVERGHQVSMWSPRTDAPELLRHGQIRCVGVLEATVSVDIVDTPEQLAHSADTLLVAVPANGHQAVMDALIPHLRGGQIVIVSAMNSLSSLYFYEEAVNRGVAITVVSFGTTALTARRVGPAEVRINVWRQSLGMSCLPRNDIDRGVAACRSLYGSDFTKDENALATALTSTNPVAHGPLAIFNWTRIERAEAWPQFHYMTERVSAVIKLLDTEKVAVARAFGLRVQTIEEHFARSFQTSQDSRLSDIAAELHAKRGGPPGPIDVNTRFLAEDVPYGLVFTLALSQIAEIPSPATQAIAATASLLLGTDFSLENSLISKLHLKSESMNGLLARVNAGA